MRPLVGQDRRHLPRRQRRSKPGSGHHHARSALHAVNHRRRMLQPHGADGGIGCAHQPQHVAVARGEPAASDQLPVDDPRCARETAGGHHGGGNRGEFVGPGRDGVRHERHAPPRCPHQTPERCVLRRRRDHHRGQGEDPDAEHAGQPHRQPHTGCNTVHATAVEHGGSGRGGQQRTQDQRDRDTHRESPSGVNAWRRVIDSMGDTVLAKCNSTAAGSLAASSSSRNARAVAASRDSVGW